MAAQAFYSLWASELIGAVWAPHTRGKTLQQIEVERYGAPVDPRSTQTEVVAR